MKGQPRTRTGKQSQIFQKMTFRIEYLLFTKHSEKHLEVDDTEIKTKTKGATTMKVDELVNQNTVIRVFATACT